MVLCSLSACTQETYEDGYEDGYADGFFEGQIDGYSEGIAEAQHDIAFMVEDDLSSLARDIEDEYGLFPEDALTILSNHADASNEVTKEELNNAIWAIYRYYHKSREVINGIEDYWID